MSVTLGFGVFLVGLGFGIVLGRWLGMRELAVVRREMGRRKAELRNHVLPLLEQRALGSGVPPDRRARNEADPLIAAIELGRAIQEVEARVDLPFSDTLQVSQEVVQAELGRQGRNGGGTG
jgi:hypothetical protein